MEDLIELETFGDNGGAFQSNRNVKNSTSLSTKVKFVIALIFIVNLGCVIIAHTLSTITFTSSPKANPHMS